MGQRCQTREEKNENNFDREIKLKKELASIKILIENAENKINAEVFKLYGLSEQDIAVVAGIY